MPRWNNSNASLPALSPTGGGLGVGYNDNLQNVSLPALTSTGGDLNVGGNANLQNLSLPTLTSTGARSSRGHNAVDVGASVLEKRCSDAAEADRLRAAFAQAERRAASEAEKAASEAERAAVEAEKTVLLEAQMARMEETSREEGEGMEKINANLRELEAENAAALEKFKEESHAKLPPRKLEPLHAAPKPPPLETF